MTHDELLQRVQSESANRGGSSIAALIAVVELHKPFIDSWDQTLRCNHCPDGKGDAAPYPCSTIEAIQRGLE